MGAVDSSQTGTHLPDYMFSHARRWLLLFYIYIYKGKVIPLQARCGPEGGQRYSSTLP